jgi:hypothetical protein
MQINMKIIEHEGIKYPLIIDLNAMEDFQKSFFAETGKSIMDSESFENFGLTAGILQFQAALNEGIDYENQKKGSAREFVTKREAGRIMSEIGMEKAGSVISELTKEFNGKNAKTAAESIQSAQDTQITPPAGKV